MTYFNRKLSASFCLIIFVLSSLFTPLGFALTNGIDVQSGIYYYSLPNGQKLYVKPIHQQKIITIDTWVNVGSVQEVPSNNGLSHFLEHLLFKGTPKYPNHQIDATLGKLGASFNAATSKDFTHYHITAASGYFEQILDIHSDMLLNADIPTDELNNERKVVQEEINRALDEPTRKVFTTMTEQLFANHPYSQETLGPKKNIANIPRQEILDFYHRWYEPHNFSTVVVGDIEPEKARQLVETAFTKAYKLKQGKHRGVTTPSMFAVEQNQTQPKVIVLSDPNITQPSLMLVLPAPDIQNAQDNIALDIATSVLGGGASSRLNRKISNELGLARSIGAGNHTLQQGGMLYFTANTTTEDLPKLRDALLYEISLFSQMGPSKKELDKTVKQLERYFVFLSESTADYAETVGYNVALATLEDFSQYLPRLKQTSTEEVRSIFNKYYNLDKAIWIEMIPNKDIDEAELASIKNETSQSVLSLISHYQEVGKVVTGYASSTIAERDFVINQQPIIDIKKNIQIELKPNIPQKFKLASGLQVIYKYIPDAQTVALQLYNLSKSGLLEDKAGSYNLASRLFLNGTQTRKSEEILEDLERQGIDLGASSGNDYFSISGTSTADDFKVLIAELTDILKNWQLNPDEYQREKAYYQQELATRSDSPKNIMFENLGYGVFPDHPYGLTSKQVLNSLDKNITPEDIKRFYQTFTQTPSETILVVAGKISPSYVPYHINPLIRLFSNPIKNGVIQYPKLTKVLNQFEIKEQKPKQATTWMGKGWQGPTVNKPKQYAALKILSNILGGGFTSRMFDTMRNKNGVAYETAAIYAGRKQSGVMTAYIGTDPSNEEKVRQLLDAIIMDLKTKPVQREELEASKSEYIGEFFLAHEKVSDQANFLGIYEALGAGFQYDEQLPKLIKTLKSADVLQAAKILFKPKAVTSIVAPQSVRTENE